MKQDETARNISEKTHLSERQMNYYFTSKRREQWKHLSVGCFESHRNGARAWDSISIQINLVVCVGVLIHFTHWLFCCCCQVMPQYPRNRTRWNDTKYLVKCCISRLLVWNSGYVSRKTVTYFDVEKLMRLAKYTYKEKGIGHDNNI